MSKEEIQKAILEERRLASMVEGSYKELITLERNIIERKTALSTIEEDLKMPLTIKSTLVPIGGGIFIYASSIPTDKVLVDAGANIYLTKTKIEVKESLEKSLELISKKYSEKLIAFENTRKKHSEVYSKLLEYQISAEK